MPLLTRFVEGLKRTPVHWIEVFYETANIPADSIIQVRARLLIVLR